MRTQRGRPEWVSLKKRIEVLAASLSKQTVEVKCKMANTRIRILRPCQSDDESSRLTSKMKSHDRSTSLSDGIVDMDMDMAKDMPTNM